MRVKSILAAILLFLHAVTARSWAGQPGMLLAVPADRADDPGIVLAARELGRLFQDGVRITTDAVSPGGGFSSAIIVGAENIAAFTGKPAPATPADTDAFKIIRLKQKPLVTGIIGGGVRGEIFALFYIAERLRLDSRFLEKTDRLTRAPAFPVRIMSGDPPESALRYGYNTAYGITNHTQYLMFDAADPGMFDGHDKTRDDVVRRREEAKRALETLDSYHLDSIAVSDEFVFPRALLDRPYAAEMLRPGAEYICFCEKKTWELYAAKYRELLETFPPLDNVMIRLGENYAKGDYFGNIIADDQFWNYCTQCAGIAYNTRIATLMNRTHSLVVSKGGRRYIHRTWDCTDDKFHPNPEVYLDVLSNLKDKTNLVMSVKYTATDFWRYTFPNPTIGIGDVPQIIEYQCAREYEGKGAYPNYIGEQLAEAYRYVKAKGAVGAWNWHHGGGWDGPTLKTDLWNDANIYAAAHLAWDPSLDARALAEEWAALKFGHRNAKGIADLMLISDDAVLKMVYFKAYAERKGSKWMPNENWVRDDVVKGDARLSKIYETAADSVDEMVAEKDEALALVERMIEIARGLELGEPERSQVLDSLEYERLLFKTLRHYAAAYFYYRRWKDTGAAADRELARRAASLWNASWLKYRTTVPALPWSATLYFNDGMEQTMEKVVSVL